MCFLLQINRLGRTICVPEKDVEDMMVDISNHSFKKRSTYKELIKEKSEIPEVEFITRFMLKSTRPQERLSENLKFKDLRKIIEANGYAFSNQYKGTIDVVKTSDEITLKFFFFKQRITKRQVVANIAYHGEGADVSANTLKYVRECCGLTQQDGFDGAALLRDAQPTFKLIASYRTAFQNLAYR